MAKFTICLVAVISVALDVSLAGSIGYKSQDELRGSQVGFATGKCSALSWLLPDPQSGCCGRHAEQEENREDDIDNNYIDDRTNENVHDVISFDDDYSQNDITNDDERRNCNSDGTKCISDIINNVINNVLDNIKDRIGTWATKKHSFSGGIISLEDKKIIPNQIAGNISPSAGLSPDSVVGLIAEGKQTGLRQYPWLVHYAIVTSSFLFTTKTGCGGSLISPRFVLTAAHCLEDNYRSYNQINVFLAEYNTETPRDCVGNSCIETVMMHPDKVIIHEAFVSQPYKMINDIALMRLRGSAPYTDYIRPICLPPFNIDLPNNEGAPLTIAGWGDTGRGSSPIKLATQVQLVTHENCKTFYSQLSPGQMCAAGRTGQDACPGDSGGPIMMEKEGSFYLVGVISGKSLSAACGSAKPAFYTNVFSYKKWIEDNMDV